MMRQERDSKFEAGIEGFGGAVAIRVDEPCGIGDGESPLAEEPLVELNLAFVGNLPLTIDGGFVFFGCGFVIGHHERVSSGIDPDVIQRPVDVEVRGRMEGSKPLAEVPPVCQIGVTVRNDCQPSLCQERRRGLGVAIGVELVFHELVDGIVEREG